jgi:hypothetical protein
MKIQPFIMLLVLAFTPLAWAELPQDAHLQPSTSTPDHETKIASAGTQAAQTGMNSGDSLLAAAVPVVAATTVAVVITAAGGALKNRTSSSPNNKSTTGTVP